MWQLKDKDDHTPFCFNALNMLADAPIEGVINVLAC